jgi:hypothetical protein
MAAKGIAFERGEGSMSKMAASEIQRIVLSTALGATEGAPPLHVELEPTGGPLNRVFGRGSLLRGRVADAALAAKDRVPEPLMRVAVQVLRPPRK